MNELSSKLAAAAPSNPRLAGLHMFLPMPGKAQAGTRRIRVMLVDDEPFLREALGLHFSLKPDLEVCGEAESEPQALERVAVVKPDLAVVDLGLRRSSGLSLIKQLHQRCPDLKIVVFSKCDRAQTVASAFAAGAHGYVAKGEGAEKVVDAVRWVMGGRRYLSRELAARTPNLTPDART